MGNRLEKDSEDCQGGGHSSEENVKANSSGITGPPSWGTQKGEMKWVKKRGWVRWTEKQKTNNAVHSIKRKHEQGKTTGRK